MEYGEFVEGLGTAPNLNQKIVAVVDAATKQEYKFPAADLKAQSNPSVQTLAYSLTPTMDLNQGKWAKISLNGNINLFSFSNLQSGDAGLIFITMSGSGNHTINWGSAKTPVGGIPLSAAVGELTVVGYAFDGTNLVLSYENYGAASTELPPDTTPPYMIGAVLNVSNEIWITMSKSLGNITNAGWLPLKNGEPWSVAAVSGLGAGVYRLQMSTAAAPGDVITLAYARPPGVVADNATNPNFLASFNAQSVPNNLSGGGTPQLAAPTGNSAVAASQSQINISCNTVANATAYVLEESTNGTTGFTQIYSGSTPSYNRTGLSASTTRYYRWKAQAAGYLDSNYSLVSNATTNSASQLATPQNFTATPVDESQINLACDPVPNATSYAFWRSPNGTNGWVLLIEQSTPSYSSTGLTASTQYFYRVNAKAAGYVDSNYATANATTTSGSSYDPASETYFTAAGITDNTQKAAADAEIVAFKAGANLWANKIIDLYPIIGGTDNRHKVNAKRPTAPYALTYIGSPSHGASGMNCTGGEYGAETYVVPGNSIGETGDMDITDFGIGIYCHDNVATILLDRLVMGCTGPNFYQIALNPRYQNDKAYCGMTDSGGNINPDSTDSTGFWFMTRTANNVGKLFRNGVLMGTFTATQSTLPNTHKIGVGGGRLSDNQYRSGLNTVTQFIRTLGLSDSEVATVSDIINDCETALSRNTY